MRAVILHEPALSCSEPRASVASVASDEVAALGWETHLGGTSPTAYDPGHHVDHAWVRSVMRHITTCRPPLITKATTP